jgi:hypothetical protein
LEEGIKFGEGDSATTKRQVRAYGYVASADEYLQYKEKVGGEIILKVALVFVERLRDMGCDPVWKLER